MSKHTGGEWVTSGVEIFVQNDEGDWLVGVATETTRPPEEQDRHQPLVPEYDEAEANARGMAAWTELLAACESVASAVRVSKNPLEVLTLLGLGPMDLIRDAIAKATEESP